MKEHRNGVDCMYRNYDYTYYETRFILRYPQNPTKPKHFRASIEPVFKLFELNRTDPSKPHKIMVIEQRKWANIALISVHEKTMDELKRNGAELLGAEHVFKDETDAKIQLAYVCSKFMIEPDDVYEATEGFLRPDSYKKLLRVFYDDFPEKYI